MPAVTAPPNIVLPRITSLDPGRATLRGVRSITTSPRGFEGEGFPVRRAFAGVSMADLDPFIHLDQMGASRYQDIRANAVALLSSADGGALVRVIAGEVDGHPGPGVTYSPISVVHATIQPGAEVDIPWRTDFNALVYVLSGAGYVAGERRPIRTGQLAVLGSGDAIRVGANAQQDSHTPALGLYIMGGLPIGEPVAWYGPFVMNTHEELARAFDDYRAGRLGVIPD